ncbi:MAG: MotA/TolQ/ExbB proton channel family protein [Clostridia bacterium]|nr:MotA/TolQ/ExbB proton channel family protein [Clostridia bacterium]
MDYIKTLMGLDTGNPTNALIYLVILFVFLIGILYCIVPVLDNRGRLRRAVRLIKAGSKSGGKAKRSWQEDNFLGKGAIMAHWSAYLNNLFFADGEYHNPSNVEDFINEETVIYGPGRSAFADAVPSLLVSLGFLGTLIGLAQGLTGFDMTNASTAQQSIMTLIPGMKYAFTTSIVGVVGSVLFTLITRAVYGSTEHTLRSFYGAMSRYAGVISVDPLTQLAIYQQEQTALIQTMAKDLNGSFTQNLGRAVHDAVEPINQNLRTFMTVTSKEQMRFLDAVVMRFVDRMDETLKGRFAELGNVIGEVNRSQREACELTRASLNGAGDVANGLADVQAMLTSMAAQMRATLSATRDMESAMTGYLRELEKNSQMAEEGYGRIASTVEQMNLLSNQQTGYLKSVSSMQAEVTRAVEAMTGSVNNLARKYHEDTSASAQAQLKAAGELRQAAASIEQIQKNASAALQEEMNATMDSYREYVNQFTQRVDYLAGRISESLNELPRAVGQTSDQLLDQVDALSRTLEQAQRALREAAGRL